MPDAPTTPPPLDDDAAFLRELAQSVDMVSSLAVRNARAERLRALADRIQTLQDGLDQRCSQDVRFNLVHIADQAGKKHFFNALATAGELVTNLTRHLRDDVRAFAARPIAPERAPALRTEGEDAAVERLVAEFPDLLGPRPCRTNEQLRLALAVQREIQAARGPAPERVPAEFMQLLNERAAAEIAAMSPEQRAEFKRNAARIVQILQHDAPREA